MKTLCITFVLLLAAVRTMAQPYNIDSLNNQLPKRVPDSTRLNLIWDVTEAYQNYKPDSGLYYARLMIGLAQKLKDKFYMAAAFNEAAFSLYYLGDYAASLQMALNGKMFTEQLYKEGKPERLVYTYLILGLLDRASNRNVSALANFKESIKLVKTYGINEANNYGLYSQLAATYVSLGKVDSALFYAKKAYDLSLLAPNKARLPIVYNVLGNVYANTGNYQIAKKNYYLAIDKAKDFNFLFQLTRTYNDLATLFSKQGQQDSCIYYAQKSVELSNEYHYPLYAVNGYNLLAQMYELRDKPDSTLKYMKLMLTQKDSVFSQAKAEQYQQLVFDEEQRKQQEKNEKADYQNTLKIYILSGIVMLAFLIASILYYNNRQKQKANGKLHQQQAKTEQALNELKATQAQLIQSEKMASLGELTAGIAHEIQNPLNFVNNFSEVSAEMIDEMEKEFVAGNNVEGAAIVSDIKQNLGKVIYHGKRADAIVKGMLQHSRSTTVHKEPTDINALADEYLRLSYHGLRAKDKSFNATMNTNFDRNIGEVNIIPQEIGRVLLNLYNNAFYVVNEKKKQAGENYEPTVLVTTKKLTDKIEVSVKDNGNGIPQSVTDKIFQPFFTTKPTGQGTGLGLSLSYDIIKAHGGEMRVESKEGEGAEFTIQLPVI